MVHASVTPHTLYPDSDGQPMADNTEQYEWIVRLATNLKHLLKDEVAFVAGDLLWYPVEVETPPAPRQAPDVLVALGRPPGYRGSYKQWEEDNVAPQVIFEILSPGNTRREMALKQKFYDDYGVLEMYYYDPQRQDFWGFVREQPDEICTLVTALCLPWTSPLLKIRFELFEDGLAVFYPDGAPFRDPVAALAQEQDTAQKLEAALAKLQELGIDPDSL
ncbi:Uma2 family endonuclease [Spirulina major CS-329]|uniref:Uma2 family endonuclease n=1 Tax=Spirulina TaxID=1154 RepID=UPI00232DD709|nr:MULTISPECIES: Uma2 family endonuclease [Spirulina]MDB9493508.1 Uma2 family endonuclease [Spirulina subsalsa CS-330]MDB9501551.1 Uma2 family endonuclease [Spirulina major CS-329]